MIEIGRTDSPTSHIVLLALANKHPNNLAVQKTVKRIRRAQTKAENALATVRTHVDCAKAGVTLHEGFRIWPTESGLVEASNNASKTLVQLGKLFVTLAEQLKLAGEVIQP